MRTVLTLIPLVLASCIKAAPPVQAPQPWTVAIVTVLEAAERDTLAGAPETLTEALQRAADDRALNAVVQSPDSWLKTFTAKRTTEQRVEAVAESARTDLLLVVETDARWYSQIAGRFRWTVDVDVTFGRSDQAAAAARQHFEVPVALLFDHQRESEAVAEATPIIERRVTELMDTWLRAASDPE
jgi:hypothetical protein